MRLGTEFPFGIELKTQDLCDRYGRLHRPASEVPVSIVGAASTTLVGEERSILDVISGWDVERHRTILDEVRDDKRNVDDRAARVDPARGRRCDGLKSRTGSGAGHAGSKTVQNVLYSVPLHKFRGGFHVASSLTSLAMSRAMVNDLKTSASPSPPTPKEVCSSKNLLLQKRDNEALGVANATAYEGAGTARRARENTRIPPRESHCNLSIKSSCRKYADSPIMRETTPLYVVRCARPEKSTPGAHCHSQINYRDLDLILAVPKMQRACFEGQSSSDTTLPSYIGHSDCRVALSRPGDFAAAGTSVPSFIESGKPLSELKNELCNKNSDFIPSYVYNGNTQTEPRVRTQNMDLCLDLIVHFMLNPGTP